METGERRERAEHTKEKSTRKSRAHAGSFLNSQDLQQLDRVFASNSNKQWCICDFCFKLEFLFDFEFLPFFAMYIYTYTFPIAIDAKIR